MKKTILSLIFAFLLSFSVMFVGCRDKGLRDNPNTSATVISNGGMSVIKGDYLYFVNGYVDETTLTKDDNKNGKVKKGAIYRTKLDNLEISKTKEGFLKNADPVVSKVVGFSNGGFHIIDDYIFYATPYMKLNSSGQLQNNRVEIHRVNINGTKDETIYTTSQSEDKLDWTMRKVGDKIYLVISEGSKIVSVNAKNGDKVGEVTLSDTSSYAFLHETEYHYSNDVSANYNDNHIYYTRSIDSSDNVQNYQGNVICSMNIATGDTEVLERSTTNTYTLKHITSDTIYYTYTNTAITEAYLYKRVITDTFANSTETQLTDIAYTNYHFADYGNDLIVAEGDNGVYRLEGSVSTAPEKIVSSATTIFGVYGDYAYHLKDTKLVRTNIRTGEVQNVYGDLTNLVTNENYLDFDGRRVYVYTEYTAENEDKNYYLNYFEDMYDEENFKQKFVGVFESDDVPAKPEQPEPEFEGDEVEYIPHVY